MLPLTWVPLFSHQLYGYMESEPLTLQLFIGTADDRLLRPHAFYQVHRITGKTVSTASHEVMQSNTKILEIPLLPENNMRAMWVLLDLHKSPIRLSLCTFFTSSPYFEVQYSRFPLIAASSCFSCANNVPDESYLTGHSSQQAFKAEI